MAEVGQRVWLTRDIPDIPLKARDVVMTVKRLTNALYGGPGVLCDLVLEGEECQIEVRPGDVEIAYCSVCPHCGAPQGDD
jgi:hypothetical protein